MGEFAKGVGRIALFAIVATMAAASTSAQNSSPQNDTEPSHSRLDDTRRTAGTIVTQPARDIGASKTEIPPLLLKAADDPYSLSGLKSCQQIAAGIGALNDVLGPDFGSHKAYKENRAGKLAEEGGKTVINSFIPFRGLVREVTGAAPAERRYNAAVAAGYARRGFLRGVARGRGCN